MLAARQVSRLPIGERRFDRVVVITAPDELKITRYAAKRSSGGGDSADAENDARRRLAHQIPDSEKAARADYVLENTGDLAALRAQVEDLWGRFKMESNKSLDEGSLK